MTQPSALHPREMMPLDADITDDALLVLYVNGDRQAAGELTQRLVPRLFSFCTRLLGNRAEAEEVAQEAMLRLWMMAPDWVPGEAKLSTWVFRVARNLCTDVLRKRRSVPMDDAPEMADDAPGAEAQMLASERVAALDKALASLPDRQREAVILRHIEGLSNPEIAAILEISVEAVESLTARGKRSLAQILAKQKEELGL